MRISTCTAPNIALLTLHSQHRPVRYPLGIPTSAINQTTLAAAVKVSCVLRAPPNNMNNNAVGSHSFILPYYILRVLFIRAQDPSSRSLGCEDLTCPPLQQPGLLRVADYIVVIPPFRHAFRLERDKEVVCYCCVALDHPFIYSATVKSSRDSRE